LNINWYDFGMIE